MKKKLCEERERSAKALALRLTGKAQALALGQADMWRRLASMPAGRQKEYLQEHCRAQELLELLRDGG